MTALDMMAKVQQNLQGDTVVLSGTTTGSDEIARLLELAFGLASLSLSDVTLSRGEDRCVVAGKARLMGHDDVGVQLNIDEHNDSLMIQMEAALPAAATPKIPGFSIRNEALHLSYVIAASGLLISWETPAAK